VKVPSAGGSAKHIAKSKVGVARRGLKEAGGKLLTRRTETASGIRRRASLQNKMKPNSYPDRRCKCGGYMVGKNAILPEEVSRTLSQKGEAE